MRLFVETRACVLPECCSRLAPYSGPASFVEKDQKAYFLRMQMFLCEYCPGYHKPVCFPGDEWLTARWRQGEDGRHLCISQSNNYRVLESLVDVRLRLRARAHSKRNL